MPKCQECNTELDYVEFDKNQSESWACPVGCRDALPNCGIRRETGVYEIKIHLSLPWGGSREVTIGEGKAYGYFVEDLFRKIRKDIDILEASSVAMESAMLDRMADEDAERRRKESLI